MEPFKTAALSLVTVFVCLALLLMPDFQQSEPPVVTTLPLEPDSSTLIAPPKPVHIGPQHSQVAATDRNLPVEPDENIESAGTTSTSQLDNWPLMLYPELARIAELENLPADTALAELVPMLSNADPVVRLATFESLMDMNHPALLPTLSAALDDADPQVRILVLQALGTLDEPMAVSSIEPYLFDRETDVRLAAIEALSNLEYDQAAHTLASVLSDQDANIRHQAVNALGEIGGEQAIAYLRQARVDPDADIRTNAITILEELGETVW